MSPRPGERAGLAALVAFLALDVVLVGLALRSTDPDVPGAGARRGSATSGTSGTSAPTTGRATTATPPAGTTTSSAQAPTLEPVPLAAGVFAVDGDRAWRYTVGSCESGGSTLSLTDDGGRSWQPRAAPFDTTTRVRVRPNGTAFAVGADSECEPLIRQTDAAVSEWGPANPVSDAWFRDPRDAGTLGVPVGGTAEPCGSEDVVDLAVVDSGATALCADGRTFRSETGSRWSDGDTVEGAVALAVTDKGRALAVVPGLGECRGLAVVDAKSPGSALGCAESALKGVKPGTVAISVREGDVWLVAGPEVFRSSGRLGTWTAIG